MICGVPNSFYFLVSKQFIVKRTADFLVYAVKLDGLRNRRLGEVNVGVP